MTSPAPHVITFQEFEILEQLISPNRHPHTITLNNTESQPVLQNLLQKKLVRQIRDKLLATPAAELALEPYRVKRAVILAAGRGERLRPESDQVPKPMTKIHTQRFIETQLDALANAGISDITIVRGYKGEMFDELLEGYPHLKFIDNPEWHSAGAIVSAALAIDKLAGAYLIEADLYIKNTSILRSFEYRSSWYSMPIATQNDWFFSVDETERIHALDFGTTDHHRDYKYVGIHYWAPREVKQLETDLPAVLETPSGRQAFIESVPFAPHTSTYEIYARQVLPDDVTEVDTFEELQALRARENSVTHQ